ncbi:hypothetical protein [Nocardioides deserti]|uniref:GGDEF domain-containing protein n=1 Tax=Nocardioides deserti TaxID=1588644 RepID=A0ABR6U7U9_9ACTN|nr:hypothetical protein [Nocardioides deserti]MBC2960496.1 hypothetical protein [Nocardioides deserti]GGO71208.1 hypothetical protein GCM10012276_11640 [Nocardioides deserti]
MEVPPPHPAQPSLLATWTTVQQAVRMASTGRLTEARALLQRAAADLRPGAVTHADGRDDLGHVDPASAALLVHLDQLLATLADTRHTTQRPADAGSDLEHCARPVRRGDVLCLLRVRGGGPTAYDDLLARAGAALRADDQLVTVADDHVLVVLAGISRSIAWRRMSGLVGGCVSADGGRTAVVHAGLAVVSDAGPAAALEAARGALLRAAAEAAGRIALAQVA